MFAPGFSAEEQGKIVYLSRFLFLAQGIFVASYVLTGVLESLKFFFNSSACSRFLQSGYNFGHGCFVFSSSSFGSRVGCYCGCDFAFFDSVPISS